MFIEKVVCLCAKIREAIDSISFQYRLLALHNQIRNLSSIDEKRKRMLLKHKCENELLRVDFLLIKICFMREYNFF